MSTIKARAEESSTIDRLKKQKPKSKNLVVESKARTLAVNTEEIVPETKVEKVSKKKSAAKAKKKKEGTTETSVKTKKPKKVPSND